MRALSLSTAVTFATAQNRNNQTVNTNRVTLNLEATTRARNARGEDIKAQILHMRLDLMPAAQIAAITGCSVDYVQSCIDEWQAQIRQSQGEDWNPMACNPRRWGWLLRRRKDLLHADLREPMEVLP